jgi:tetratricopeptide (TPR) repeat protein
LENPAFASTLAGLQHNLSLTRLTLHPFTASETEQLVHSLTGTVISTDLRPFSQWLFNETGGHPFYIMETLQVLLEQGLLPVRLRQNGIWQLDTTTGLPDEKLLQGTSTVPPGIQKIIQSRLKPLSGNSRSLLAAAAVLGHAFTFEQMCQVAHISEDDGLPALETLLNGRLLQEDHESFRADYFFSHDNIRHTVYSEISEARRRIYHRRVVELLKETGSSAANLAHHALTAGMYEAAFHYNLNAGDEAMRLFAVKDAIAHFEQARQIIRTTLRFPPIETLPLEQLQQLYSQLGRAYELNDEFEKAHELYQGMLSLARELNEWAMSVLALNHLATTTAQGLDDVETAVMLLHEARELAVKHAYLVGQAETEWNLAHIRVHSGDPEASLLHAEKALALARQSGQQELVARCLNTLAYATTTSGKWTVGKIHAEEAQKIYQVLGNRALVVDNLCLIAKANINIGRPTAAIPIVQTALDISLEIGNLWGQTNSSKHLGMALLECGRYAEALDVLQKGVALARQNEYTPLLAFNLSVLGMLYRHLMALDAAIEIHHEVANLNKKLMSQPFTKTVAMELCADYALAEDWSTAGAYARQVLAAKDNTLLHGGLYKWLEIAALIYAKEIDLARTEVRQFGERYGQNERYQIPYYRSLAVLAEREADIVQAIGHLEQAVAVARQLDLPGEQWPILVRLAQLHPDEVQQKAAKNQAVEIINRLAEQIEDKKLREEFATG